MRWSNLRRCGVMTSIMVAAAGLSACSGDASAQGAGGRVLHVVAAENFWGSIVAQIGGAHVSVISIVSDPNADPHEYESNTQDARAFASADYVILNGAGYDDWAGKLLAAEPAADRTVLTVAALLGKHPGDNPHFWYSPQYVQRVADRMVADLSRIEPADAAAFRAGGAAFSRACQPYLAVIRAIAQHDAGQPVAATESIVGYLVPALHLHLISPQSFMDAVAEGNEPPAAAVASMEQEISSREPRVLLYNLQTVTAVTTDVEDLARVARIPVVGVSETMQPPTATFQSWQLEQLLRLQGALAHG